MQAQNILKKRTSTFDKIYSDYIVHTQNSTSVAGEFHSSDCKFSLVVMLQATNLWF